jgi:predicted PurR-regulated permease PerM
MSRQWSDSTKRLVATGLAIVFVLALYRFRAILPPLVVAILIAYVLTPVVDFLQRRSSLPRTACVLIVDLFALATVAAVPAISAPILMAELREVNVDVQGLVEQIAAFLSSKVTFLGISVEMGGLQEQLSTSLQRWAEPVVSHTLFLLVDVATGLLWAVFVFVVSFYLMRDWHRVTAQLRRAVPPDYREDYDRLAKEIGRVWQSFFRGQVVLSAVIFLAVTTALAVVGVRNALILGLLAGVLEVVPNVGPVVAAVPAVLLALVQGSSWLPIGNFWFAVLVAGLYVLIQQLENNYLVPRIIGRSVNLHPLVVLVGVIAGARLAGILGIFLAAPTLATGRILLRYVYAKLLDLDPFPPESQKVQARAPKRLAIPLLRGALRGVRQRSAAVEGHSRRAGRT